MKSGDERTGALHPLASPAESPSFCYKLPKRSVTTLGTRPLLNVRRPFKERPSRDTHFAFLISFAGSGWLCCSQRPSFSFSADNTTTCPDVTSKCGSNWPIKMLHPSVSVGSAQGGYLAVKECGKAHFKWSHQCVTATEVGGGTLMIPFEKLIPIYKGSCEGVVYSRPPPSSKS